MEFKRKVCLVGDFSVGKTSLTQRYVNQVFSEKYLTTIGVKIDTKTIDVDENSVKLILWDVAGRDSLSKLNTSYLVGAAGVILVLDGTKRETILSATSLIDAVYGKTKEIPTIVLVNKVDLKDDWEYTDQDQSNFEALGWNVRLTSAKSGEGVEEAFAALAKEMLANEE